MFETSVVREGVVNERHLGVAAGSLALHVGAGAAIVLFSLRSLAFPGNAPRQLERFVIARPVDLALPAGRPEAPPARPAVPAAQRQVPAPQTMAERAPSIVPAVVPEVPASSGPVATTIESGAGDGAGDPRGVPGGDPNAIDIGQPLTAPSSSAPSEPIRVTGEVHAPVAVHRVDPLFPAVALRAHMSGVVRLECIIDRDGHVREAHVLSSTFSAFDDSALTAVRQWRFVPGSLHGKPVDTIFELTVTFNAR